MGFGEVVDLDFGGIDPPACSAADDDGDFKRPAGRDEMAFLPNGVDGIDDGMGGRSQEGFRFLPGVEGLLHDHFGVGINEGHSIGEGGGFGVADGRGGGVNLTIGIGDAEVIEIDEGEFADSGAGEGFDRPRADAAEAHDHDMAL